jgi:hypothetical protein
MKLVHLSVIVLKTLVESRLWNGVGWIMLRNLSDRKILYWIIFSLDFVEFKKFFDNKALFLVIILDLFFIILDLLNTWIFMIFQSEKRLI